MPIDLDKAYRENMELRRTLWLNHGHTGLYGDDGEMQCPVCNLDFKRDPVKKIIETLEKINAEMAKGTIR